MATYFYLEYDTTTGIGTGCQVTSIPLPAPLPSGVIVCTQAEAYQPGQYQVVNGVISGYLPGVKAAQVQTIKNAALVAMAANLSFTTSGGVSTSFSMAPRNWSLFVGRYAKYVVYAQPLPSPFGFKDINSLFVPFTLADFENFFNAAEAQIVSSEAKEISLIAQINAVTGISDNDPTAISQVQAIVW